MKDGNAHTQSYPINTSDLIVDINTLVLVVQQKQSILRLKEDEISDVYQHLLMTFQHKLPPLQLNHEVSLSKP